MNFVAGVATKSERRNARHVFSRAFRKTFPSLRSARNRYSHHDDQLAMRHDVMFLQTRFSKPRCDTLEKVRKSLPRVRPIAGGRGNDETFAANHTRERMLTGIMHARVTAASNRARVTWQKDRGIFIAKSQIIRRLPIHRLAQATLAVSRVLATRISRNEIRNVLLVYCCMRFFNVITPAARSAARCT